MTIPTYLGLQTALSGLEAAQIAIDTTGENIANASTPGYSRQTVNLTEQSPLDIPSLSSDNGGGSQLGTGVTVADISRVRDTFLDSQYRAQNTTTSGENTSATILGQAQAAFNEPSSSGLSGTLNSFWNSWQSLSTDPGSEGAQQAVISGGQAVAEQLNTLSGSLTTLQSQVTQQYDTLTNTSTGAVANDANQIAQLNGEIAQAQSSGVSANDLKDQRDSAIDDLSQYSSVYVSQNTDGTVDVYFGQAATTEAAGGTSTTPALVSGSSSSPDLTDNLTQSNLSGAGGTLGSLLNLNTYDSTTGTNSGQLQNYLGALDSFASNLASTVDSTIAGADSAGATAPAFFTGSTAATIAVNSTVTESRSSPPYTATEADAVFGLSGSANDPTQAYSALVTQVGSDVQSTQNAQSTAQSLLTAIGNQRQSVSGVSLDEEMTNLIGYQQAYQASARVMSTINDTFTALIGMVSG
jgi:flagellar hook-associated protein 1